MPNPYTDPHMTAQSKKELQGLQPPFAVIEAGGKQYFVSEGTELKIEKMSGNAGEKLVLDRILMTVDAKGVVVLGNPYIVGATIPTEIIVQGRAKKIRVSKFRPKSNYRKVYGHRQPFTQIKAGSWSGSTK